MADVHDDQAGVRVFGGIDKVISRLLNRGRTMSRLTMVTDKAVAKHINSILAKLDLPPADDAHRRVLAVLTYLDG